VALPRCRPRRRPPQHLPRAKLGWTGIVPAALAPLLRHRRRALLRHRRRALLRHRRQTSPPGKPRQANLGRCADMAHSAATKTGRITPPSTAIRATLIIQARPAPTMTTSSANRSKAHNALEGGSVGQRADTAPTAATSTTLSTPRASRIRPTRTTRSPPCRPHSRLAAPCRRPPPPPRSPRPRSRPAPRHLGRRADTVLSAATSAGRSTQLSTVTRSTTTGRRASPAGTAPSANSSSRSGTPPFSRTPTTRTMTIQARQHNQGHGLRNPARRGPTTGRIAPMRSKSRST